VESKKYQIFISSTYKDLIPARKKVSDAILKSYHFPVGMELFSAGNESQWEVITKIIDKTDYYILILGHRYGSLSPEGIGYTEMEYNYAKSLEIPVLSFIRDNDVATKENEREPDPDFKIKLETFRQKAMDNKMCDFWKTEEDLESKILMALYKSFATNPRIGWVRGDQAINPEIANEMALLTKENRELKKKLEKTLEEKRAPEMSLKINNKKSLEIECKKIKEESLSKDVYNMILNNRYNLEFNIANIGTTKANNIIVDVTFPEEAIIIRESKLNTLKKVEARDLIKTNNSLRIKDINFIVRENNTITIRLQELMHTRVSTFPFKDPVFVVPLKKGKFEIKVSIVCEEFSRNFNYTIPLIIK